MAHSQGCRFPGVPTTTTLGEKVRMASAVLCTRAGGFGSIMAWQDLSLARPVAPVVIIGQSRFRDD